MGGDYLTSITIDNLNNIIITVYFANQASFCNDTTLVPQGFFLAKYDTSKNLIWIKQSDFNTNQHISGWDVITDTNDNIYLIGAFSDTIVFGNDTLIPAPCPSSQYQHDYCVLKFDKNGNYIWGRQFVVGLNFDHGCIIGGIACDKNKNVYVSITFANYCIIENDTMISDYC